ncbi:MAG: hypothetical protein LBM17_09685, partial [Candidatus Accumulibacter sp.]|nr:hypothetical protein [Accumulibacter sp.]
MLAVFLAAAVSGGDARSVRGGCSWTRHATENRVSITGGTVHLVTGGESAGGDAARNTVTFTGGRARFATGGESKDGDATQNTVTISGGKIGHTIHGGHSGDYFASEEYRTMSLKKTVTLVTGKYRGDATDNTVTLTGDADLTNTTVLTGGFTGSSGEARKGNTLHIDHWTGTTRAHIANFENYRFTLPANLADGQSILTTGNSVDLGDAANVRLDFAAPPAALREDFSIRLISVSTDGAKDAMTGTLANTRVTATVGTLSYTFDLALQEPVKAGYKHLAATLRKVVG